MKNSAIILLISIAVIGLFLGEINTVVGEIVKPLSDKPITGNAVVAASCTVGGGYYKDCYKSWGRTRSKKKARAKCTLSVYDDQTYTVDCNDKRISFKSIICQSFSKKGLIRDITTKILCEDYVRATKDGEKDDDVGKRIKISKTSDNKLQLWLSDINCWDCDNGRCTNYGRNRRSFKTFTCEVDIPTSAPAVCISHFDCTTTLEPVCDSPNCVSCLPEATCNPFNVGSTQTILGKRVQLLNVGSTGSVIVNVTENIQTIPYKKEKTIEGLRITPIHIVYASSKHERSANLMIR